MIYIGNCYLIDMSKVMSLFSNSCSLDFWFWNRDLDLLNRKHLKAFCDAWIHNQGVQHREAHVAVLFSLPYCLFFSLFPIKRLAAFLFLLVSCICLQRKSHSLRSISSLVTSRDVSVACPLRQRRMRWGWGRGGGQHNVCAPSQPQPLKNRSHRLMSGAVFHRCQRLHVM